jgi:hypothetical protein
VQLSIFAFEVCLPYEPSLHEALRAQVAWRPPRASKGDKWTVYNGIFQILANAAPHFHRGCWDYFDDDSKARRGFTDWSRTLEGGLGPRTAPSGEGGDPYRGVQMYMTATTVFQIRRDSACDQRIRTLCNYPDAQLWRRQTFVQILGGLGALNFDSIQADVAYVIPRDSGWCLTLEDLATSTFDYLRVIVD